MFQVFMFSNSTVKDLRQQEIMVQPVSKKSVLEMVFEMDLGIFNGHHWSLLKRKEIPDSDFHSKDHLRVECYLQELFVTTHGAHEPILALLVLK